MRLTDVLYGQSYRYLFKQIWKRKGLVREPTLLKPRFLTDNDIDVVDPRPTKPVFPPWEPTVKDDPRFMPKPALEDHHDYHEDQIYRFNMRSRLLEDEKQALLLTKTQPFYTLPQCVTDLIGAIELPDQDELVQRYIMQANVWNPTKIRLPKRFDNRLPGWKFKREFGIPERKMIATLLQNLLRLCQTTAGRHPDVLASRRLAHNAHVSASYYFSGEKQIQIKDDQLYLSSSSRALAPFASEEIVDESVTHQLPDLFPVSATIDLTPSHIWRSENITGWRENFSHANPHTVFLANIDRWSPQQRNARALMFAFANCVAAAKQKYGNDVKTLREPISTQCVTTNGISFNFVCFQLNTLNFDSEEGVKNLVWFDNNCEMYKKILPKRAMLRNTKYEDYNPEVFQKFLAFYMNGINLN